MMDLSGNCWMVSDPGYCFQTYPDPDLPTQLLGLTSGLICSQGLVWLSGFLLNLVTITRPVLLALLGYCGTGHLPVMQLSLPPLVSPLVPASTCYFLADLIVAFHGLKRGVLGEDSARFMIEVHRESTRGNRHKLLEIPTEYMENFIISVVKPWNRLPKVVTDFPSLEVFKTQLDKTLNNLN